MKQISKRPSHALIQSTANLTAMGIHHQLSYRFPMPVAELMVFSSSFGYTAYYVCPRCHITMEREYQSYCDRCGQRLGWTNCQNARIVYPGAMGCD
jgi:hypothetical protein